MSLINQMLKDLENRTRHGSHSKIPLADLNATKWTKFNYNPTRFTLLLAWILTISIMIFFIMPASHRQNQHQLKWHTYLLKAPAFIKEKTFINIITPSLIENHLPASVVTGLTLQVQDQATSLRLLLSQDTFYQVSKNVKNDYIVLLTHTQLVTNLPSINTLNSSIKSIKMINKNNGDLLMILSVKQNAELNHLELINKGKYPELQMDFIGNNDRISPSVSTQQNTNVTPQETGTIRKFLVNMSAEEEYQQALQYSAQGLTHKAIAVLTQVVTKFPDYDLARESLTKMLLEQGKITEAKNIIQPGLKKKPFYYPYAELKARILVSEGQVDEAVNVLQNSAPSITQAPEFHAFIAALYQRQGKSLLAANVYEQLLPLQPNNAMWWLGLGIAYEDLGRHSEAVQAYARAEQGDALNPELKAYIQSRMHSLQ